MNYKIVTLTVFDKQFKRLAKKYPSLKNDIARLGQDLQENPTLGQSLGGNFYKVRLKITSKRTGKAGGARVITYVKVVNERSHSHLSMTKQSAIQLRTMN